MLALATCLTPSKIDEDEAPLLAALAARAVEARFVPWDADGVDWSTFSHVVLRSTWNYVRQSERFLSWVDHVGRATRLHNAPEVVRWNAHKRYLLELEAAGLPIVPTRLVPAGQDAALESCFERWSELVIKPAISAGSFATIRVGPQDRDAARDHLATHGPARDMLIQPYLRSVGEGAEHACVCFFGALSHGVAKRPRFAGQSESVTALASIPDQERILIDRALAFIRARFDTDLLYTRIDVVDPGHGTPAIMELELIEPSLFLLRTPGALDTFAAHLAALVT